MNVKEKDRHNNALAERMYAGATNTKYLARVAGVSELTINKWIKGQPPKNIDTYIAVADYLEITIDELVKGVHHG